MTTAAPTRARVPYRYTTVGPDDLPEKPPRRGGLKPDPVWAEMASSLQGGLAVALAVDGRNPKALQATVNSRFKRLGTKVSSWLSEDGQPLYIQRKA